MAAKPLVYIHGAGRQLPAKDLKTECDMLVFGKLMPSTRVAYYANVRWPPTTTAPGPMGGLPATRRGGGTTRDKVVRAAADRNVSARAAAAEIVADRLAPGQKGAIAAAARGGAPAAAVSADTLEAQKLAEKLFRRADRMEARSSPLPGRGGRIAGVGFPDPIFRWIVGAFASDVIDYLFGGFAEAMRLPVRAALLSGPPPGIVVAHSLGTIITYDVLSEPAFKGLDIPLMVTLGSPLGIDNVQKRLRNGAGKPNPVPKTVKAWSNFADRFDPVAIEATLRDEFSPPDNFAKDTSVNNSAANNHDLSGYLAIELVRTAIVTAVGT